jgi:hypothetical protein
LWTSHRWLSGESKQIIFSFIPFEELTKPMKHEAADDGGSSPRQGQIFGRRMGIRLRAGRRRRDTGAPSGRSSTPTDKSRKRRKTAAGENLSGVGDVGQLLHRNDGNSF